MVTPQFLNVGSGDMPLENLVRTGDAIDVDGAIYIQTLSAGGTTVDSYQWIDWGGSDVGWMNDDYEIVEGVTFPAGAGLWVGGTSTSDNLQSAGKVGTSDVIVQLRNGCTASGNPFPVAVNLQDIVPQGDSIDGDGAIYIQTLSAGGTTVDSYQWIDWGGSDVGWMNDDYEIVEGVTFAPGEGLWIGATSTADYIRFPAPTL